MFPPEVQQAIARGRAWSSKLIELVSTHLPRDVPSNGAQDNWKVTGPAFVARITILAQAILHLPDNHEAEAAVLLRVLYEHLVLFAWLATDPAQNLRQWLREDRDKRISADNDLRELGLPPIDGIVREMFEAHRDSVERRWSGIAAFAKQADDYWSSRIVEFSPDQGLRKMYLAIYRGFSPPCPRSCEAQMDE